MQKHLASKLKYFWLGGFLKFYVGVNSKEIVVSSKRESSEKDNIKNNLYQSNN